MKAFVTSVLYVLSIVVAVAIGMFQVGVISDPVLPLGSGGPGCNFRGQYISVNCSGYPPCTRGSVWLPALSISGQGSMKSTGTSSLRGDCSGGVGCTSAISYSQDLTNVGCGG